MRIFPKQHFKWSEPWALLPTKRALLNEQFKWTLKRRPNMRWLQPLLALGGMVLIAFARFLNGLKPGNDIPPLLAPSSLCAIILGGLFYIYGLPFILGRLPMRITLFDKKLTNSASSHGTITPYSHFETFSWRVRAEGAFLFLVKKKGTLEVIGVPHKISREAVSQFLIERGLALDPVATEKALERSLSMKGEELTKEQ